jgi:hypothetical protein
MRIRIEQTNATTYGNLHREIAHKQDTGGGDRFREAASGGSR